MSKATKCIDCSCAGGASAIEPPERAASNDLIRLVYASLAAESLSAADLHEIAAESKSKNARCALTGFLLFGAGRFYGVIEGARRQVFARMERIATDRRHRRLVIISEDAIDSRRFAGWSFNHLGESVATTGDRDLLDAFIVSMAGRL